MTVINDGGLGIVFYDGSGRTESRHLSLARFSPLRFDYLHIRLLIVGEVEVFLEG